MIELEDEVQEFEPNQDAGTRQILSVQVDVSDVRFLRPSTRLVLAENSMTVPVVLADHPLLLSYSVVESPVLSLLIGRDVVEGLGLDIKGSSKTLEYNGRSQPLDDSVAGHYSVTLLSGMQDS